MIHGAPPLFFLLYRHLNFHLPTPWTRPSTVVSCSTALLSSTHSTSNSHRDAKYDVLSPINALISCCQHVARSWDHEQLTDVSHVAVISTRHLGVLL
jgi:hypothetical protein